MLTRGETVNKKKVQTPVTQEIPHLLSPLGGAIVYPYANVGQYLQYYRGWIFRAIEFRAKKIGACLWQASKTNLTRGQFEDTPMDAEQWIPQLFEHPNPEFSMQEIIEDVIRWLDTSGDAYIYTPAREFNSKLPLQMWVLPSWAVYIVPGKPDSGKFIDHFTYTYSGAVLTIQPDEMIHFRHPVPSLNPYQNYFYGRSLMAAMLSKIRIDESADLYLASHFENFATPSSVIQFPSGLDGPAYQTFKQRWLQDFKGAKNAGKFGVLTDGATLQPVTSGHREVEIQDVIKENAEIMTQIMGVALNLLTGANANYATAVANRRAFDSDTRDPLARYIAAKMTTHFNKWEVGVKITAITPRTSYADFDPAMLEILLKNNVLTSDDVRPDFGEEQFAENGDVRFVSNTMVPVNLAAAGAGAKPPAGPAPATVPKSEDSKKKSLTRATGNENEYQLAEKWKAIDDTVMTHAAKMEAAIKKVYADLADYVVKNLDKFRKSVQVKKGATVSFDALFNEDDWKDALIAAVGKEQADLIVQVIRDTMREMGVQNMEQSEFDKITQEAVEESSAKITESVDTVRDDIRQILKDNYDAPASDLEALIRDKYEDYPTAGAIAETTAGAATTTAQLATGNAAGVKVKWRWLTQRDDRVRDAHVAADGQIADAAGMFHVGGEALRGPRLGKIAGNNINCRCILLPTRVFELK